MEKRRNSNNGLSILLGAIAGGALGYYMASDAGKEFRKEAMSKLDEVNKTLKENYENTSSKLNEKYEEAREGAGKWATNLKERADKFADTATKKMSNLKEEAEDAVDELGQDYDRGIAKAKSKLNKATS